ncbi:MAG: hypothetical protein L0G23_02555 [Ruaniaceae bacterium]|nr:hypothetical protein [Ruaniaceae bacterium]
MSESPEKPSRLKRAAKWYSYVSDIFTPQRIGLLLGAAVLSIVGIFGGWDAVGETVEDVTLVEVGETATATPFAVTPTRARVFDELEGVFYAEEGYRYIVVIADVENTSARFVSSAILAQGASLDAPGMRFMERRAGPRVNDPSVVRSADSLSQATFQPNLATNIVLVWQQEVASPIPETITLTLSDHTWRSSVNDGSFGWRDATPAVRYVLPLETLDE